jgi:hypothetical protein
VRKTLSPNARAKRIILQSSCLDGNLVNLFTSNESLQPAQILQDIGDPSTEEGDIPRVSERQSADHSGRAV